MENISYHKWATTIVMNCLCRASNSRSQTPEAVHNNCGSPLMVRNIYIYIYIYMYVCMYV